MTSLDYFILSHEVKYIDHQNIQLLDEYLDTTRELFESLSDKPEQQDLYYKVLQLNLYIFNIRLSHIN